MKLDPATVETAINKMDALCDKGREQVRQLFTDVFDVSFQSDKPLSKGTRLYNTLSDKTVGQWILSVYQGKYIIVNIANDIPGSTLFITWPLRARGRRPVPCRWPHPTPLRCGRTSR